MTGTLPEDLARELASLRRRRPSLRLHVEWHDVLSSTMDRAAEAVADGVPAGFVVAADAQTAGRGRRGRTWASPTGAGLYLSLVTRPRTALPPPLTTIAAGVGVRSGVLAATGLAADLKWPNDLMVRGRKLAGILAEGHGAETGRVAVVIGVGINLRAAPLPPEIQDRATSLEVELGLPVERGPVLVAIVEHLIDRLAALERHETDGILQAWRAAAPLAFGARVEWDTPGGVRRGSTDGVDEDGALRVKTAAGIERIVSGEVRWT